LADHDVDLEFGTFRGYTKGKLGGAVDEFEHVSVRIDPEVSLCGVGRCGGSHVDGFGSSPPIVRRVPEDRSVDYRTPGPGVPARIWSGVSRRDRQRLEGNEGPSSWHFVNLG
jgi:hypothetical protein